MEELTAEAGQFALPAHVPPEMAIAYDSAFGPEVMAFPPAALDLIRPERAAFYSTMYGGFWVFTRYEDVRRAFQDHRRFVQYDGSIPPVSMGKRLIPLSFDGGEHLGYRKLMMRIFAPRQIARLEPIIRRFARERLAHYAPTGEIEFASEFALAVSSAMFCGMLDLPYENFPVFHRMSYDLIYGASIAFNTQGPEAAQALRYQSMQDIDAFLVDIVAQRKASPGDDAISILLGSEVFGRPVTDEEALNMAISLFFAGTDSTAGAVSYAHAFLAEHPAIRAELMAHLDDDDYVWNASEELLRFHGFHHLIRRVAEDCEFAGIQLRQGDLIVLYTGSANRDDEQYPDPYVVDLERRNARTHMTFGAGNHRCIGAHLATLQLRVALQEVHRAIPDYRLASPVEFVSGGQKVTPGRVNFHFTPTDFVA